MRINSIPTHLTPDSRAVSTPEEIERSPFIWSSVLVRTVFFLAAYCKRSEFIRLQLHDWSSIFVSKMNYIFEVEVAVCCYLGVTIQSYA